MSIFPGAFRARMTIRAVQGLLPDWSPGRQHPQGHPAHVPGNRLGRFGQLYGKTVTMAHPHNCLTEAVPEPLVSGGRAKARHAEW